MKWQAQHYDVMITAKLVPQMQCSDVAPGNHTDEAWAQRKLASNHLSLSLCCIQSVGIIIIPWNNFTRIVLTHFFSVLRCISFLMWLSKFWVDFTLSKILLRCLWSSYNNILFTGPKMVLSGRAAIEFGGRGREHNGSVTQKAKKPCWPEYLWLKPSRAFTTKTETCIALGGCLLSHQEYSPPEYQMWTRVLYYIPGLDPSIYTSEK